MRNFFSGDSIVRTLTCLGDARLNIDPNAPLSIIVPAIIDNDLLVDDENIVNLARGVVNHYGRNVIIADISAFSTQNYGCIATLIAPKVAEYLAGVILALEQIGVVRCQDVWVGGHGVGAHIAGLTSERLPQKIKVCWGNDINAVKHNEKY